MTPFTHLHVHTQYSLLDGAARIDELLDKCKQDGMDSLAITDHGVMYGVVDFYKAAKARGIRPIIGCEVYVAPRTRKDMQAQDREAAHLVLLCENEEGYLNLIKMVSLGFTEGFYYRPRIDYPLLKQHSGGLIALSACLSGDIPKLILQGRYDEAKELALRMKDIFGPERYYLEMQDHGIPEQRQVNAELLRLSKETGIGLVATNDVHYVHQEDAQAQDILLCIQTGKTVDDQDRMSMTGDQFYLKSPEEMEAMFGWCPEALANTAAIAARCQVDFEFGHLHLPDFPTPNNEDHAQYFRRLCYEGLAQRYDPITPEIRQRMEYEITTIEHMGYVDYFLIVWDFIRFARSKQIEVGPGRGSGAGSICAYALAITEVDPIRYSLLFERFLNPDRISMPDIDIDFCYERRGEVIDYVIKKYGADHVAQIITFGTMAARAVIRDVGRALNMGYGEVDAIAKMVPNELNITLQKALEKSSDLREKIAEDPAAARLMELARKLEGLPRHASTHAAGVVISQKPLTEYLPLARNGQVTTTQFPMTTVEELGLLKMDFLGLRTLTVIRDAVDMINASTGEQVDIRALDFEDPTVYGIISEGDTDGIFQLEGQGMRNFLRELKPDRFEDIIAGISLYRPGPMEYIPKYIWGKNHPDQVVYDHPLMERSLAVTYGCMVYQEQVMQIVRDLAGYSLARSDLVRKAMSKKKHDVMVKEREIFVHGLVEDGQVTIPGCVRNGVPETTANKIFDDMMDFASYAFNKSHAAAYAVVAYRTAWLKVHHPVEFMAATLNSVMGNTPKVALYVAYCRKHGAQLLPPNINRSGVRFTVESGNVRFGLAAVRNVGEQAVKAILQQREEKGPYQDLFDFLERVPADVVNKRLVESLIKAGAFDHMGANRAQYLQIYEQAMDSAAQQAKHNLAGQLSLFDMGGGSDDFKPHPDLPQVEELPQRALLAMEKEMTGIYISGHPLDDYREQLERFSVNSLHFSEPEEGESTLHDGQNVTLAGIITELTTKATRNNDTMAFLTLDDLYGSVEALLFPATFKRYRSILRQDELVVLQGRASFREGEDGKLVVQSAQLLQKRQQVDKLFLKQSVNTPEFVMEAVKGALHSSPGGVAVYLFEEATGKKFLMGKDLWVDATPSLLEELRELLGADCVKVAMRDSL